MTRVMHKTAMKDKGILVGQITFTHPNVGIPQPVSIDSKLVDKILDARSQLVATPGSPEETIYICAAQEGGEEVFVSARTHELIES